MLCLKINFAYTNWFDLQFIENFHRFKHFLKWNYIKNLVYKIRIGAHAQLLRERIFFIDKIHKVAVNKDVRLVSFICPRLNRLGLAWIFFFTLPQTKWHFYQTYGSKVLNKICDNWKCSFLCEENTVTLKESSLECCWFVFLCIAFK